MLENKALSRLLDEFLFEHPEPTAADWRAVLVGHPEFRTDIADFAATYSNVRLVTEDDVRSNFFMTEDSEAAAQAAVRPDPLQFLDTAEGRDELVREFRLQKHQELVLGLLIGQVMAPRSILQYWASKASRTVEEIMEAFDFRREEFSVSMSSSVKPELMPVSPWADEVERLVEDGKERARLLALDA
jgi:hypothetical protein